jgi:FkbM family methyltransferase
LLKRPADSSFLGIASNYPTTSAAIREKAVLREASWEGCRKCGARFDGLETSPPAFSRAAIVEEGSKDGLRSAQIAITTLDSLLAPASKPVSFIKLDVESYELSALKGVAGSYPTRDLPGWWKLGAIRRTKRT